jgi:NitT/TauT family transport system substrate-binding protein
MSSILRILGVVVVILSTGSVTACEKGDSRQPPPAKTPRVVLQLKWLYNAGFSGDLVAQDRHLWRGLDVSVREGGPAINVVNAVVSGQADFGVATGDQILLARENGAPIVAIALAYRRNPLVWITRRSEGIKTARDLRGRTVGLTYIDDEPLYRAWVGRAGLNPETDIRPTRVQFDLSPFLTGNVAAYPVFINTQGVELANKLGPDSVNFVGPEDAGIRSYSNLYFTTTRLATERPEIVAKFVDGIRKGWALAADSPAVAVEIVSRYDRTTPPDIIRRSVEATNQLVRPDSASQFGVMELSGWNSTATILREAGVLKDTVDMRRVFTNRFLQNSAVQPAP